MNFKATKYHQSYVDTTIGHDCLLHSYVKYQERVSLNTFRRTMVCKICNRIWEIRASCRGFNITDDGAKIKKIIEDVCAMIGVNVSDAQGKKSVREVSLAKHISMYIARESGYTISQIGAAMNNHHTAVLYGCRRCVKLMKENQEIASKIRILQFRHKKRETQLSLTNI